MSDEILNITVIIVVLTTIVITIMMFTYQMIFASLVDGGKSIPPNYREGYETGKVHGLEDNRSGNEHNDRCPPGDYDILWRIGYEIGYNDGYYGEDSWEIGR